MAQEKRWWVWLLAAALVLFAALLLINFFATWPIDGTLLGLDWKGIWNDLQGGRPHFNTDSLLVVPWDAALLLPLGWLSFRVSWAVIALLILAALVISVPVSMGRWRHLLGLVLLATSFPALRQIADGNLEWMVIPGFLLTIYGYEKKKLWPLAVGLLLATAKVQEAWVPCLVLGIYLLRTWPARQLAGLAWRVALFVIPALLWLGQEWVYGLTHVTERGSIMDSSLFSTLSRLRLPEWLTLAGWLILAVVVAVYAWRSGPTFSRQKAAILVAASLLLSPYAAGNSYLTVLAIGILPLILAGNPLAIGLLLLADLPFFVSRDLLYLWSASYWAALLLLWLAVGMTQSPALLHNQPGAMAVATPEA